VSLSGTTALVVADGQRIHSAGAVRPIAADREFLLVFELQFRPVGRALTGLIEGILAFGDYAGFGLIVLSGFPVALQNYRLIAMMHSGTRNNHKGRTRGSIWIKDSGLVAFAHSLFLLTSGRILTQQYVITYKTVPPAVSGVSRGPAPTIGKEQT
jgi:hypothetical protein